MNLTKTDLDKPKQTLSEFQLDKPKQTKASDEDKKQENRLWDHLDEASHDHTGEDKDSFRDSNFRRQ